MPLPPPLLSLAQTLWQVLRDNALVLGMALGMTLAARVLALALGMPASNAMVGAGLQMMAHVVPLFAFVLLVWRLGYGVLVVRPARPLGWLIADISGLLRDGRRMLGGLVGLAAIMAFLSAFSLIKDMIPALNPFFMDETLAGLDRALHGGTDPWALLQPLTARPGVLHALDGAYQFWLYLNLFCIFTACFAPPASALRRQFLTSYVLVWLLVGTVMAILLSSGGPVYFAALGFGDQFQPLTTLLTTANAAKPLWAVEMQAHLWATYSGASAGISGISAMPSMHVASSVTMALFAFGWRRWAGVMVTGFAVTIQIGSVALGWHYALDGYVGSVMALVIWSLVARSARRVATPTPRMATA